jgi:hypothetical protein
MLKIILSQWEKNKDALREVLSKRTDLDELKCKDLVKLTFEAVYNNDLASNCRYLDLNSVHEIDDGAYQGTLLYLIPFASFFNPSEHEYLMTYVGYGSCSACDALQSIQCDDDGEDKINDFMKLCKDILTNTIKPYNGGWRKIDLFEHIEEE